MFADAAVLFGRAKEAFERCEKSSDHDRQPGQMGAIDAVVFSVVALEGFINEVSELARKGQPDGQVNPPSVENFGQLLGEVEDERGGLRLKFMLAHWVFTGQTYDASRPPFQDFILLIKIRNAIIHHKTEGSLTQEVDGSIKVVGVPKLISPFESKHILAKTEGGFIISWTYKIATAAFARWACNTSSQVINSIIDMVPECSFKESLKTRYQK